MKSQIKNNMEDNKIEEILDDPQKLLNLFRMFHQLIHIYDKKEMDKELERQKTGTKAIAGLADSVSILLKDSNGNIKRDIN